MTQCNCKQFILCISGLKSRTKSAFNISKNFFQNMKLMFYSWFLSQIQENGDLQITACLMILCFPCIKDVVMLVALAEGFSELAHRELG